MNDQEFLETLRNYQKQWQKLPSNGSRLVIELSKRVLHILDKLDIVWHEGTEKEEVKELPLIIETNCPCPYEGKDEPFIISHCIKDTYEIFHDGFWAYMAQTDQKFAHYCTKRSKYTPTSTKTYTYVQPKRALHYLLANGTPVTKNKIRRYFKLLWQKDALQEFAEHVTKKNILQ